MKSYSIPHVLASVTMSPANPGGFFHMDSRLDVGDIADIQQIEMGTAEIVFKESWEYLGVRLITVTPHHQGREERGSRPRRHVAPLHRGNAGLLHSARTPHPYRVPSYGIPETKNCLIPYAPQSQRLQPIQVNSSTHRVALTSATSPTLNRLNWVPLTSCSKSHESIWGCFLIL